MQLAYARYHSCRMPIWVWVRDSIRLRGQKKRALLLEMALGVFTSAGVVHLRVQREAEVSNLDDLLLYSLDDLEEIATEKGSIRQLLDEKWRKVCNANTPGGVFTTPEMRAA